MDNIMQTYIACYIGDLIVRVVLQISERLQSAEIISPKRKKELLIYSIVFYLVIQALIYLGQTAI